MGPPETRSAGARLLRQARSDADDSTDELFRLVYNDLRRVAARHLRNERADHTLQPTALVNEAYIRLIGSDEIEWSDRNHFFAVASRCIRRILTEHARRRATRKRGDGIHRVTLCEESGVVDSGVDVDLVSLEHALTALEEHDARRSRVVELRFFGGLTIEDTASALGVSPRTVKNDWRFARAWLYARLEPVDE